MSKRTCAQCARRLHPHEFSYSTRAQRYDSYCRSCRATYVRTKPRATSPQDYVRTTLLIPEDLHAWLTERARALDLPLRALAAQILSRYRSARVLAEADRTSVRSLDTNAPESIDSSIPATVDSTSTEHDAHNHEENR